MQTFYSSKASAVSDWSLLCVAHSINVIRYEGWRIVASGTYCDIFWWIVTNFWKNSAPFVFMEDRKASGISNITKNKPVCKNYWFSSDVLLRRNLGTGGGLQSSDFCKIRVMPKSWATIRFSTILFCYSEWGFFVIFHRHSRQTLRYSLISPVCTLQAVRPTNRLSIPGRGKKTLSMYYLHSSIRIHEVALD